jgi:VIT1/CCC1 family predicted Fe2+/Mn2+ transporter
LRERGADALDLPCETPKARPIQAAIAQPLASPWARPCPLIAAAIVPLPDVVIFVSATSLVCLAALRALAARTGGASVATGTMRATLWGALAMAVTAGVGALFGTIV